MHLSHLSERSLQQFRLHRPQQGGSHVQVNYYSYLKVKAENPDSALGGYTRILHCSQADDIMHLVPTLVVEHLPPGLDRGYGPMHRPWAFSQWLSRMHIPEEYIFMSEPDHVFVSAPPLVATPSIPAAFPFFYVDCKAPQWKPQCENPSFNPRRVPVEKVPRVCQPSCMRTSHLSSTFWALPHIREHVTAEKQISHTIYCRNQVLSLLYVCSETIADIQN